MDWTNRFEKNFLIYPLWSRQRQRHTKRVWNKFETILTHFEMFQLVWNGITMIPFETISITQTWAKYHWGTASRPPNGVLDSFGLSKLFQMVPGWYHLKQFETFRNVSKGFKIVSHPFCMPLPLPRMILMMYLLTAWGSGPIDFKKTS